MVALLLCAGAVSAQIPESLLSKADGIVNAVEARAQDDPGPSASQAAESLGSKADGSVNAVDEMAAQDDPTSPPMVLATIPAPGEPIHVDLPVGKTTHFNVWITLAGVMASTLDQAQQTNITVLENGVPITVNGEVVVADDPNSASTDGPVSLYFDGLDYVPAHNYILAMSWDPTTYSFDPTNLTGLDFRFESPISAILPVEGAAPANPGDSPASAASANDSGDSSMDWDSDTDPGSAADGTPPPQGETTAQTQDPSSGGSSGSSGASSPSSSQPSNNNGQGTSVNSGAKQSSQKSSPCRTYYSVGLAENHASVSSSTSGGNIFKDFARVDYNTAIYWHSDCTRSGPGQYSKETGYSIDIRGENNPARGGPHLLDVALAHRAPPAGAGSSDGFGYQSIFIQPMLTLAKPGGNQVQLESTNLPHLNKESCTGWPDDLSTALSLIPVSYWWSVVITFSTKTYCTTKNWVSQDTGPSNNYAKTGFKITKAATGTQYEHAAYMTYRTYNTGTVKWAFTYASNVYGTVKPQEGPQVSFNRNLNARTGTMPASVVV